MNKLKQWWGYIAAGLTAAASLALYIFMRRGDKVNELKAKVVLAGTEKQADVLETEIKHLKENKDNLKHENKELDKALGQLEEKRKEIADNAKDLKNPKDVADYWNNN